VQLESHILIVDDDLEIRKLLGRYLAEPGFRVTLASDKRTVGCACRKSNPDILVV
jgi:two-component system OmpR family response regulator